MNGNVRIFLDEGRAEFFGYPETHAGPADADDLFACTGGSGTQSNSSNKGGHGDGRELQPTTQNPILLVRTNA